MSDADIPSRFGPATKWVTAGIFLFVFALGISESAHAREPVATAVYCILFIATFIIAVKWKQISDAVARWRGKMVFALIVVGLAGALALGVAIGGLLGRFGQINGATGDTGRIAWNFQQIDSGQANFLNMIRLNQEEIRVVGVGAHGKNTSKDPVTEFSGHVRSDLTNARLPIFIMAQNPDAPAIPTPFQPEQIPTRPEQTFGIPGLAEFDIVTYEDAVMVHGVSGIPVSQFLREFGSFTMVLEYDGIKVERQFSKSLTQNFTWRACALAR